MALKKCKEATRVVEKEKSFICSTPELRSFETFLARSVIANGFTHSIEAILFVTRLSCDWKARGFSRSQDNIIHIKLSELFLLRHL